MSKKQSNPFPPKGVLKPLPPPAPPKLRYVREGVDEESWVYKIISKIIKRKKWWEV